VAHCWTPRRTAAGVARGWLRGRRHSVSPYPWTGTALLDASSGEHIRHRLSRAGNRRMNHVLHIAAIVQLRHDTPGAGVLPEEACRWQDPDGSAALPQTTSVRRRVPTPRCRRRRSRHGPGRALRGDSHIQRGRPAPAQRHFGSATSRTRNTDATPDPLGTSTSPSPKGQHARSRPGG
jgi:hypothetical protein